jgi:hypothetical protein
MRKLVRVRFMGTHIQVPTVYILQVAVSSLLTEVEFPITLVGD